MTRDYRRINNIRVPKAKGYVKKLDGSGKDGGGFCLLVLVAAGLSASGLAGAVIGRWPS